jgi:hypothetical protein
VTVMIRQADTRTELVSVLESSVLPWAIQKRRPTETPPGRLFALIFEDRVHTQRRAPPAKSPESKAPHMRGRR